MTHDPLCRISKALRDGECCADDPLFGYPCQCGLIAEVRQQSAKRLIAYLWESGIAQYTYSGDMDDMVSAITGIKLEKHDEDS